MTLPVYCKSEFKSFGQLRGGLLSVCICICICICICVCISSCCHVASCWYKSECKSPGQCGRGWLLTMSIGIGRSQVGGCAILINLLSVILCIEQRSHITAANHIVTSLSSAPTLLQCHQLIIFNCRHLNIYHHIPVWRWLKQSTGEETSYFSAARQEHGSWGGGHLKYHTAG